MKEHALSVPDLSHRLYFGSSVSPQRQRFGDGKRSYTDLIRNDSLRGSYFQMSPQGQLPVGGVPRGTCSL